MTKRHTTGEWEARGTMVVTPPSAEIWRRIKAGEMPFDCKLIGLADPNHYVSKEEAEANTRLMAASPELLDVALAVIERCRCKGSGSILTRRCDAASGEAELDIIEDCRAARAAVAKAIGSEKEVNQ